MTDPGKVAYDRAAALVVVDVQNDFVDPAGTLYVPGAELLVPLINAEVARARRGGAVVVYTQDWHPERTPHFRSGGGTWPTHCVHDTWGAALYPSLVVAGPRVRKGSGDADGYSGFSVRDTRSGEVEATALESMLRERMVTTVVIAGVATDYCVKETALDAAHRGFATVVLGDAMAAVDLRPGDGERALETMRRAGVTVV